MQQLLRTITFIITILFCNIICAANYTDIFWNGVPYTLENPKEQIVHECGIAFVRLRKPLAYYTTEYKDSAWGLKKLLTLMERQRHRGQDGAGIAAVKFDIPAGKEYTNRLRFASKSALDNIFEQVMLDSKEYLGEVMLGHVRYATHSGLNIKFCQPFERSHSIAGRNITFAGNFNMTNTNDLLKQLQEWGLSPISESDTQIVLESFTHQLDHEYESMARQTAMSQGDSIRKISQNMDLLKILRKSAAYWDGGYVFCGMLGSGDSFCCRDAAGIRPGFYYKNDDVFAVASERVALMDAFDADATDVMEIKPGHAIIIKRNGTIIEDRFTGTLPEKKCTFERIYFSKANDPQIYQERKSLGRNLAQRVYDEVGGDLEHAVFSYVPNSSLPAFQGLIDEVAVLSSKNAVSVMAQSNDKYYNANNFKDLEQLMRPKVRNEVLIAKNQKMRTFISSAQERVELGVRLYEVTQGIVQPEDTLVIVDDSLVRGTTFRDMLMKKLVSLKPKRIILVLSAPPIMYPDCYGIDISQLGNFVAFQAAIEILKDRKQENLLQELHALSLQQNKLPANKVKNVVKKIYANITLDELSEKIAKLITPAYLTWHGEFKVIYQTVDGLHKAIPDFSGDWYFTGDYPTAGGYKVLNTAFLNWSDGLSARAY